MLLRDECRCGSLRGDKQIVDADKRPRTGEEIMPAQIVQFVSREDQFHRRGGRNFCRFMRRNAGQVDGLEASRWRDEAFLDLKADAEWAKRHGPVEGGAVVARFVRSPEQTHAARGK